MVCQRKLKSNFLIKGVTIFVNNTMFYISASVQLLTTNNFSDISFYPEENNYFSGLYLSI